VERDDRNLASFDKLLERIVKDATGFDWDDVKDAGNGVAKEA
jgi:hypothetical protein